MSRTTVHEGVRRLRFSRLLERQERGEISQEEAADLLGVHVRTFQRWAGRFTAEGESGLSDRRLGKRSPRRAPEEELERMLGLFRDTYADFTVKHFHEKLVRRHDYVLGYTVTTLALHSAGLVSKAPRRSKHRKKRARRPLPGMMVARKLASEPHQDGSPHVWIEGYARLDLIVTMDDATSRVLSAFLVEEEGTASTFQGLREVIERHGLFCEFYTDRGSHYFHMPEAAGPVSKTQLTQVGRALKQLGITTIAAGSPQARGRSERVFRTLQDRMPKELRLAEITTVEAANAWLTTYMAEHNAQFAVAPEQEGTMFVADRDGAWREILCVREERVVAKDNTVAWNGLRLQLPESPLRRHFVKATVRVHAYPDGTTAVFLGPHRLARFTAQGAEIVAAPTAPSMAAGSASSRRGLAAAERGAAAERRPALTAPRPAAQGKPRVGTKKRASSRTKKRTGTPRSKRAA